MPTGFWDKADQPTPQPKSGSGFWDRATGTRAPPPPPKKEGALDRVAAEPGKYWEDFQEANRRSGAELAQALGGFVTPPKSASLQDLSQSHFLEAGPVVAAALNRIGDPLTSPFTTAFGRPIETATGGKVSKETGGDLAALLVPGLGELTGLSEEAKIGRVAQRFGVSRPIAKAILSKSMALQRVPVRTPGIVQRAGHALSETGKALARARRGEFEEAEITPETRMLGEQKGRAFIQRVARRRDPTGERLRTNVAESMGKPVTAAEALGREAQSHLTMVGRRPGVTGDTLTANLEARNAEMPRRVLENFGEATGLKPEEIEGDFDAANEKARTENSALYKSVVDDFGAADSETIQQLLVRPSIKRALRRAYNSALETGVNPEEIGLIVSPTKHVGRDVMGQLDVSLSLDPIEVRHPTMKTLDTIKKALGKEVRGMVDPRTGRLTPEGKEANDTLRDFRRELFKINPAYEDLMGKVGDPLTQEQAFKESGKLFGVGTSEFQFGKRLKTMSDGDKRALVAGAVRDVFTKAQNSRLKINQLFPPSYRAKLAQLIGQGKADALFKQIDVERKLQQGAGRMMPGTGSHTFELESAAESMDREMGGAVQRAGRRIISRPGLKGAVEGVWEIISSAGKFAYRASRQPLDEAARDEVGRLFQLSPSELDKYLSELELDPPSVARVKRIIDDARLKGLVGTAVVAHAADQGQQGQ